MYLSIKFIQKNLLLLFFLWISPFTQAIGSWKPAGILEGVWTHAIAIDPSAPKIVYAGTLYGGIFKSLDGGETWNEINNGLTSDRILALAINPRNSKIIYAATGGGVFKSDDGGSTWNLSNNGLPGESTVLLFDPNTPQIMYAGNWSGVFRSDNGGQSWSQKNDGLPSGLTALAIDPSNPNIIYSGFNSGGKVFKSLDRGNSWNIVARWPNTASIPVLAVDPNKAGTVYAGTQNGGIFKSSDGGKTWATINSGLTSSTVTSFAFTSKNSSSIIYAGGIGGVFKNNDNQWTRIDEEISTVFSLAIDSTTSQIKFYAGTHQGLYKNYHSLKTEILNISPDSSGTKAKAEIISSELSTGYWIVRPSNLEKPNIDVLKNEGRHIELSPNTATTIENIDNLIPGNIYILYFTAFDSNGNFSDIISKKFSAPATIPYAPTSLSTIAGDSQVTITFNASKNTGGSTIISYIVRTVQEPEKFCTTIPPIFECTITGLENNSIYNFTATAINAIGASPSSIPSPNTKPTKLPLPNLITLPNPGQPPIEIKLQNENKVKIESKQEDTQIQINQINPETSVISLVSGSVTLENGKAERPIIGFPRKEGITLLTPTCDNAQVTIFSTGGTRAAFSEGCTIRISGGGDQLLPMEHTGGIPNQDIRVYAPGSITERSILISANISDPLSHFNTYLLALLPGLTPILVQRNIHDSWEPLTSPIAPTIQNLIPKKLKAQVFIEVVKDMDLTPLLGVDIYIGYGTSDAEMLHAGRYKSAYRIQ